MGQGQELYKEAKLLIPGGTQLLSKRPEQLLPELWPSYYQKAKGCEIWDLDGNKFVDMSYMGIGACTLGYADDDIDKAVVDCIRKGNMTTLNCPEEVTLARKLTELHPWADMVRYARGGGDAISVAVRIARASTGKDIILFCGYHGWHDWYLSANLADDKALEGQLLPGLSPLGVTRGMKGTSYPFYYNNKEEFLSLVRKYTNQIAGVVIEAVRNVEPEPGFFETIEEETQKLGVPLIVDEVSSGFRLNTGGAHLVIGLHPDIAVFAKGMSNGYAMAAVIGKRQYMDAAQDTFISSTYWTERIGPTAALATIEKMLKYRVQDHMTACGKKIQNGWKELALKYDLNMHIGGLYPLSHFDMVENPLVYKTLFSQEMLRRGFLATNSYYACYSHKSEHVESYLRACDEVFSFFKKVKNCPEQYLEGPVCQSGFKRLS
jgi:glutamate-1-semialdehyde aminotransferase